MPKMKSKSGAKKRFKITGSGRVKHARAYHRHNLEHKTGKQRRRSRHGAMISPADEHQVIRMLLA